MTQAAAEPAGSEALRIGRRLRSLRAERGLTIPDLAAQAGLSAGLISQIERGQSNPSMRTIQRLGAALGVNLWTFLGEAQAGGERQATDGTEDPPFVRRQGQRPRMVVGRTRLIKELLSPRGDHGLRFMIVTLPPGGVTEDMLTGPGEKGGYVITGRVALTVDGRRADLAEGDSFQFASNQPHRLSNAGGEEARVLWIMSLTETHL